jgi:small subunit ribosomal protein S2e
MSIQSHVQVIWFGLVLLQATFDCLMKTYGFLTPEFWSQTKFSMAPFQQYTDLLAKPTKGLVLEAPTETVEA